MKLFIWLYAAYFLLAMLAKPAYYWPLAAFLNAGGVWLAIMGLRRVWRAVRPSSKASA